jgi:hypothetical protein
MFYCQFGEDRSDGAEVKDRDLSIAKRSTLNVQRSTPKWLMGRQAERLFYKRQQEEEPGAFFIHAIRDP